MSNSLFQKLNGQCPYCHGTVNIVEGMVYDYTLDNDGIPTYLNTEEYRVAAYCKCCERCLYVAPNANGGYTVYPDNPAIPYLLHTVYHDNKRSSALAIKLLESEDNPFVNIDECPF